jgi:hypothetical protein
MFKNYHQDCEAEGYNFHLACYISFGGEDISALWPTYYLLFFRADLDSRAASLVWHNINLELIRCRDGYKEYQTTQLNLFGRHSVKFHLSIMNTN